MYELYASRYTKNWECDHQRSEFGRWTALYCYSWRFEVHRSSNIGKLEYIRKVSGTDSIILKAFTWIVSSTCCAIELSLTFLQVMFTYKNCSSYEPSSKMQTLKLSRIAITTSKEDFSHFYDWAYPALPLTNIVEPPRIIFVDKIRIVINTTTIFGLSILPIGQIFWIVFIRFIPWCNRIVDIAILLTAIDDWQKHDTIIDISFR